MKTATTMIGGFMVAYVLSFVLLYKPLSLGMAAFVALPVAVFIAGGYRIANRDNSRTK
jgi:hypothetical protein